MTPCYCQPPVSHLPMKTISNSPSLPTFWGPSHHPLGSPLLLRHSPPTFRDSCDPQLPLRINSLSATGGKDPFPVPGDAHLEEIWGHLLLAQAALDVLCGALGEGLRGGQDCVTSGEGTAARQGCTRQESTEEPPSIGMGCGSQDGAHGGFAAPPEDTVGTTGTSLPRCCLTPGPGTHVGAGQQLLHDVMVEDVAAAGGSLLL